MCVCVCVCVCVRPPAFSQLQLKDLVNDLDGGVKWDLYKATNLTDSSNSEIIIFVVAILYLYIK